MNVDGWENARMRSTLGVRFCDFGTKWKEVLYLQVTNKISGHTWSYEKVLRALYSKIIRSDDATPVGMDAGMDAGR